MGRSRDASDAQRLIVAAVPPSLPHGTTRGPKRSSDRRPPLTRYSL